MRNLLISLFMIFTVSASAQYEVKKDSTDFSVEVRILDSTTFLPETGVVWNTAGIAMEYRRDGAAVVAITEVTLALLTTAHADGGFLHIGNGYYRLDLPDAAVATGADKVIIEGTVTGMVVIGCSVKLTGVDANDGIRYGLTSLPNAAADAAGGLPISDSGGLDLDDIPITSEFEARTLAAAAYFLFGSDEVITDSDSRTASKADVSLLDVAISAVLDAVEFQNTDHTGYGDHFYVAPTNGNDGNDGTKASPWKTITYAISQVEDSHHDVIYIVADAAAGPTTITEQVTVNKRYVFIRGPGRDLIWNYGSNGDVITVTAQGVELSGFQIATHTTGSGDAIQITDVDFTLIEDVWFNETQGYGVNVQRGTRTVIKNNVFHNTGKDGATGCINITGAGGTGDSDFNFIGDNTFEDTTGDAINLEGGTVEDTIICRNTIMDSTGWAIDIQDGIDTLICLNIFGGNASGDIQDAGTNTHDLNNAEWAKHSIATETRLAELDDGNLPADVAALPLIAEFATVDTGATTGVDGSVIQLAASDTWEEPTNEHTTGGSFGKAVKNLTEVIISSGTAQSAANDYSIVLDSSELATAGLFDPARIVIVGGTGMKQSRLIYEYSIDGASRLAIVDRDWKMRPDNTSEYILLADAGRNSVNEGLATGGGVNTITLNALASSVDDTYIDQLINLRAGTATDLTGIVIAYNGTSKVATVHRDWPTQPTSGTVYDIQPSGPSGLINDAITSIVAALNDLDATEVQAAVNAALVAIHLDHILAVDYDPASPPGTSTAWMNELVESNAGVTRYTAAALAQSPGGGNVTVGAMTQAALAQFISDDAGVPVAADGSVAKIAQGSAGGNVTVGAMTQAALAQFATDDSGETAVVSGSIAKLSRALLTGDGSDLTTLTIRANGVASVGATVWITGDAAGNNKVTGTQSTDANGQTTFTLIDGNTYYLWANGGVPAVTYTGTQFVADAD